MYCMSSMGEFAQDSSYPPQYKHLYSGLECTWEASILRKVHKKGKDMQVTGNIMLQFVHILMQVVTAENNMMFIMLLMEVSDTQAS